jgi:hypothetical protein
MAYTVSMSFTEFVSGISLSSDHHETANARRERIVSLLSNDFKILDSFATGSIPRLTALKSRADLDVMVVLHFGKHIQGKNPSQVLQAVRESLAEYRTGVRRNGQAVTLYYDSWPNVDIVPVSKTTNDEGGILHYNVPDMNTETWIESRPRRHSNNIAAKAKACGPTFRHIVRMIKHWNSIHSDLFQSYHIEAVALSAFSDAQLDDYDWEVFQFFDKAVGLVGSAMWYEGAYADAYLDSDTRRDLVKRLATARDDARQAWSLAYGQNSDDKSAITLWRKIFGDKFPLYG